MKIDKSQIFLNDILDKNSEIIICYNTRSGIVVINRLYIRYHYSEIAPYYFFVIAKEKSESLADGTLCTINSLNPAEFNFKAKFFRTSKSNSEKVYSELTEFYQYNSPETAFEIFEVSDIT